MDGSSLPNETKNNTTATFITTTCTPRLRLITMTSHLYTSHLHTHACTPKFTRAILKKNSDEPDQH